MVVEADKINDETIKRQIECIERQKIKFGTFIVGESDPDFSYIFDNIKLRMRFVIKPNLDPFGLTDD